MLKFFFAASLLVSTAALAQDSTPGSHRDHGAMNHHGSATRAAMHGPAEPGQAAFAAIQEIVALLEAAPRTDWSKVDIEALRQHLIDMDNVTLNAAVSASPVESGLRFAVTGSGAVQDSIRRMTRAHAATMGGVDGWTFAVAEIEGGAAMTVVVPARDLVKLRALGFIGVMTRGMHHQEHHLMLARGGHPHR